MEATASTPHRLPWLTPRRVHQGLIPFTIATILLLGLLVMFCMINLLNNVDQGAIASNGVNGSLEICSEDGFCTSQSGIQGDFNLSNFQDGVLASIFIVGLLVASPIFASLAKSHNPFRLIGVGLSVWTFAIAGCGCSFNFWSIAICRMLVGVGEASFVSLAAPFIDDNAPVTQKNAWLAMFYMCIPTGTALGYVYGGLVGNLNWRFAFWGEAMLMLPFAVLGFVMEPLQLKGLADGELKEALRSEDASASLNCVTALHDQTLEQVVSGDVSIARSELKGSLFISSHLCRLSKDVIAVLCEEVYAVNLLGSIFYNFVLGAYSYWGPKTGYNMYHMTNPDMLFGVITIVCGILGTLSGGYVLDCMDATISNAFKILSGATLLGAAFCFGAFCFSSLNVFLLLFAVGELFVFATQAPANYVCLHSVEPSLRPLSMAISTVSIHIFGDVPSSPLVGVLQDYVDNWRKTALILTSILFLASGIWLIGVFLNGVDRYGDNELSALEFKVDYAEPLLDGNPNETRISEP